MIQPWKWFQRNPVEIEHVHVNEDHVTMPTIVLIHGAHQSSVSFEYMRHALPGFQYINIEWSPTGGFHNNLDEMISAIKPLGPVYLIGHSMGGIYAAHLSQHIHCIGGAAIASPWGGSRHADWFNMLMPYILYKEVGTRSPVILKAREFDLPGRWINFVSTKGNIPGMKKPNDCVLTLESMTARSNLKTKYIEATHYEIMLSTQLIHCIGEEFIRSAEKFQNTLDKELV